MFFIMPGLPKDQSPEDGHAHDDHRIMAKGNRRALSFISLNSELHRLVQTTLLACIYTHAILSRPKQTQTQH